MPGGGQVVGAVAIGCRERGGSGETGDGVLIGLGHGGLELLEEEGEALVRVVGGAARGCLDSSKAVEDRAEPAEGRVRAEAREVGPDEGEVGEVAEGGARLVVGRLKGIAMGVEPGARGGGVGEVGGHVRDRDGAIGREGGRGLKGGGGCEVSAGARGGGGGAVAGLHGSIRVAEGTDGGGNDVEKGIVLPC